VLDLVIDVQPTSRYNLGYGKRRTQADNANLAGANYMSVTYPTPNNPTRDAVDSMFSSLGCDLDRDGQLVDSRPVAQYERRYSRIKRGNDVVWFSVSSAEVPRVNHKYGIWHEDGLPSAGRESQKASLVWCVGNDCASARVKPEVIWR